MKLPYPKLVFAVLGVITLLLLISLAQEMNRRLRIQHEVQQLEANVQQMERKVIELEHLNNYFGTEAYQERLAREKLNFRAPGEKVVLVPDESTKTESAQVARASETAVSIPLRWWRAFFVDE